MIFFTGWPTIKRPKIIADMKWIHYASLWWFITVKPKNQKEGSHENLSSCKNLLYLKSFSGTPICRQLSRSTASHQNFDNKTFRIIHPFHPYRDIEFEIDHVKRIAYESRVFFFNKKGRKSSVPLHWTDIGPQDAFVTISAGRALFRVEDLLDLFRLIREISRTKRK
jgi:hypothetical protein